MENERELHRLQRAFVDSGNDLMNVLSIIEGHGMLSEFHVRHLLEKYSNQVCENRREERIQFVHDIEMLVPYGMMLSIFRRISPRLTVRVLTSDNDKYAFSLSGFFSEHKGLLDNRVVGNRVDYCQQLGNAMLHKMYNPENIQRQQFLSDCYVIVKFLQIQQLRDGGFEAPKKVLDEMMENLPRQVNSGFAWTLYQLKIAASEVYEGRFHSAEKHLNGVLSQIEMCNNRFSKALVFHDGLYIFGRIFYDTGNDEYIDKAEDMTYQAVVALNDCRSPFERLVLQHLAMIYLGIDRNAYVDNQRALVPKYKAGAEEIFRQLHQDYPNLDSRREMFLLLCQARLHEDNGKLNLADNCAKRAKGLAEFGGYFPSDRENIESYCAKLDLNLY